MNIGQTGLYFDERWLFLLILASLGYFYCLVKCYRRNISAAPRKRVLFFVVFWIISICGVFGLVLAFHDLAFAGQNYNRESDFKCMDTLPPKSNVRHLSFSNPVDFSAENACVCPGKVQREYHVGSVSGVERCQLLRLREV